MFFKKDKLLIYLNNKSLQILNTKIDKKFEFDDKTFKNQKIVNQEKFEQNIKDFLNENNIKNKIIIVLLSKDLVIEKNISTEDPNAIQEKIQKSIKETSFDQNHISKIEYSENNILTIYITDSLFYLTIQKVCESLKCKTTAVFPVPVFDGLEDKDYLVTKKANLLLEKLGSFDKVNYLSTNDNEKRILNDLEKNTKKSNKFYLIILIMVIVLLFLLTTGVFLTLLKYSFNDNQKLTKNTIIPTLTVSPTQEASKSSSLNSIIVAREDLKVKILNGSGIAGQAGLLKERLLKLGYKNIETGNSEDQLSNKSLVEFSTKVPEDVRREIQKEMDEMFSSVFIKETKDSIVDILITMGRK